MNSYELKPSAAPCCSCCGQEWPKKFACPTRVAVMDYRGHDYDLDADPESWCNYADGTPRPPHVHVHCEACGMNYIVYSDEPLRVLARDAVHRPSLRKDSGPRIGKAGRLGQRKGRQYELAR